MEGLDIEAQDRKHDPGGPGNLDIKKLYEKYAYSVRRRAREILGSEEEALEVTQELFIALIERPDQFDGRSAPLTFLYAATNNACLSRLRKQRNRSRLIEEHVRPWATDIDPRSPEAVSAVRGVLEQLTDEEAYAAIYYYLDGMSHAKIAEVLGCSPRHVGDLLERIRRRSKGES